MIIMSSPVNSLHLNHNHSVLMTMHLFHLLGQFNLINAEVSKFMLMCPIIYGLWKKLGDHVYRSLNLDRDRLKLKMKFCTLY